ncbi:hypothetical protein JCM10212_002166 [Sporobolomyces blumeae]
MPRNVSTVPAKKSKAAGAAAKKVRATRKGKSSSYSVSKLADLKKSEPTLAHREAMKKAMDAWKAEHKGKGPK